MIFAIPKASPPTDGQLGHSLLHMQLDTQLCGVLVSSYRCSSYRVADPFISLGTFSSSFIRGPVFYPIDDCEQPLLYLPGTGIASLEIAIIGKRGPLVLQTLYVPVQGNTRAKKWEWVGRVVGRGEDMWDFRDSI